MIEEYDIIYIQPEDFELFLMQYPHKMKTEEPNKTQEQDFLKLKEVQIKPL